MGWDQRPNPSPSGCSSVEVEIVVEVTEVRPESDALPVHDDNSIKSKQPEGTSGKMGGKDEAAEMAV